MRNSINRDARFSEAASRKPRPEFLEIVPTTTDALGGKGDDSTQAPKATLPPSRANASPSSQGPPRLRRPRTGLEQVAYREGIL